MTEIAIRGGTGLDRSGVEGVEADVLVRDGRIAEVGPGFGRAGESRTA